MNNGGYSTAAEDSLMFSLGLRPHNSDNVRTTSHRRDSKMCIGTDLRSETGDASLDAASC